jgi:hypothetical protein
MAYLTRLWPLKWNREAFNRTGPAVRPYRFRGGQKGRCQRSSARFRNFARILQGGDLKLERWPPGARWPLNFAKWPRRGVARAGHLAKLLGHRVSLCSLTKSGRLFQFACCVQLVVQRFQADPEFVGRLGFVAVIAFERLVDRLHLQVAKRDRARALRRRAS